MNITKKTTMVIALLAALFTVNALGTHVFAQESGRQRHGPPPEAYTACEGKSAGDTAEFVSPRGDTVTGTCEQEGDRLILRPDSPPNRRGMNDDGDTTSYAMVDDHQIAFYNSNDELVIRLTERDTNGEVGQADDPQTADTGTLFGPVDDDVAGLIWQQVSDHSKYRLADATAYPELLSLDSGNDLRLYSLTESLATTEFESGSRYIDSTRYTLVSFEETEKQYWYSNFDDLENSHEGIDSEYSVNFFSINTQGNITGIARIIPDMIH